MIVPRCNSNFFFYLMVFCSPLISRRAEKLCNKHELGALQMPETYTYFITKICVDVRYLDCMTIHPRLHMLISSKLFGLQCNIERWHETTKKTNLLATTRGVRQGWQFTDEEQNSYRVCLDPRNFRRKSRTGHCSVLQHFRLFIVNIVLP